MRPNKTTVKLKKSFIMAISGPLINTINWNGTSAKDKRRVENSSPDQLAAL